MSVQPVTARVRREVNGEDLAEILRTGPFARALRAAIASRIAGQTQRQPWLRRRPAWRPAMAVAAGRRHILGTGGSGLGPGAVSSFETRRRPRFESFEIRARGGLASGTLIALCWQAELSLPVLDRHDEFLENIANNRPTRSLKGISHSMRDRTQLCRMPRLPGDKLSCRGRSAKHVSSSRRGERAAEESLLEWKG